MEIRPFEEGGKGMAQGGQVQKEPELSIDKQMQMAFMEPQGQDPVSGNPIPPGGTAEGVRDDVPANLSEGEFVIPAHVVRFLGADKLYKMIEKAEEDIAQREGGGRPAPEEEMLPGDEEAAQLPFDVSELEYEDEMEAPVKMSQGGLVIDPNQGREDIDYIPDEQFFTGAQLKMYRDKMGGVRFIPVDANGNPLMDSTGAEEVTGSGPGAGSSASGLPQLVMGDPPNAPTDRAGLTNPNREPNPVEGGPTLEQLGQGLQIAAPFTGPLAPVAFGAGAFARAVNSDDEGIVSGIRGFFKDDDEAVPASPAPTGGGGSFPNPADFGYSPGDDLSAGFDDDDDANGGLGRMY